MVLTVKAAAAKLSVSPSLIYALAREGRLPHIRIGRVGKRGKLLFEEADIKAFKEDCRHDGAEVDDGPSSASVRPRPALRLQA
jgi:excisionase family DNA binding protein